MQWLIGLLNKWFGSTPKPPPKPPMPPPVTPTDLHAHLLTAANDARRAEMLSVWAVDTLLDSLAQQQAEYCASIGRLDHRDASGRWPDQRTRDAGYEGAQTSEILAAWQRTPQEAINSWLSSSVGHREALLSATYNEVGRGIAKDSQGRLYWCLLMGRGMLLSAQEQYTNEWEVREFIL